MRRDTGGEERLPLLYTELADWWPLLSAPADYAEEAEFFAQLLKEHGRRPVKSVLELGSGGGNNASHLKRKFAMTLVDPAPGMLAVSRTLNPECEHLEGDMRSVRLRRQFDAVFIHDAVMYLRTEVDLAAAMKSAFLHCRPGGVALFVPDCVRETYEPRTSHGGHDGEGRALRYLMWEHDPDPEDTTTVADFAYLLRDADGSLRTAQDRHVMGLFPHDTWLRLLAEAGFDPQVVGDSYGRELFVALRLAG